jgi:hypothetical protein
MKLPLRKAVPVTVIPGPVEPILIRKCDACGASSFLTVPAVVKGNEDDPRVCADYRSCCQRYRHGMTPAAFVRVAA